MDGTAAEGKSRAWLRKGCARTCTETDLLCAVTRGHCMGMRGFATAEHGVDSKATGGYGQQGQSKVLRGRQRQRVALIGVGIVLASLDKR